MIESNKAVTYKVGEYSSHVIICFGGMSTKYMNDPKNVELVFEFSGECSTIQCSYILVRDLEQVWYNKGFDSKYNTILSAAEYLRQVLIELKPSTVSTIGCSAGGYAAIIFGYFLGVDRVHAFCPQTFLDSNLRNGFREFRFRVPQDKLMREVTDRTFFDLTNTLKNSNNKTKYDLYCCKYNEDVNHLNNMKDCPDVILHTYECNFHSVNLYVRDTLKIPLKTFMYNYVQSILKDN